MRDALVAGINLNIFNKHSDRVHMANLAQLVNVLQSVILTEGEKMLLTPTYHVFHMYKYHQDADLLESRIDTKTIGAEAEYQVPNLTESVSVDAEGVMHITITNLSLDEDYDVDALILEKPVTEVRGEILAEEMHAMNSFEEPETVKVKEFRDVKITDKGIAFTIPACSVLHLAVK